MDKLNPVVEDISSGDESSDDVKIVEEMTSSLDSHKCQLCCQGDFLIDKLLRFGGLINDKYKFVCSKCDKSFSKRSAMMSHYSKCNGPNYIKNKKRCSSDSIEMTFFCPACDKTCTSKSGLTRHINRTHKLSSYKCEMCDIVFSSSKKFAKHNLEHRKSKN